MATEVSITSTQSPEKKIVNEEEDDVVDPWNVVSKSQTGVDYDKLISELSMNTNTLRNLILAHYYVVLVILLEQIVTSDSTVHDWCAI